MDTLRLIQAREAELAELHARMDNDAKLAQLNPFTLKRPDKPDTDVEGAANVTTNAPATLFDDIVSLLVGATSQLVVEGNIPKRQTRQIELFDEAAREYVDHVLTSEGEDELYTYWCRHICAKGWIGARVLWVRRGDIWVPDVRQIDLQFTAWETGQGQLSWAAPGFTGTKARLEVLYGLTGLREGVEIPGYDYWDGEKEEIWVDGKLAKTNPHRMGYPPIVICAAPEGTDLGGSGAIMHRGESVFWLNRDLYKSMSQLRTVAQTKAVQAILPSYEERRTPGTNDARPGTYPHPVGESIPMGNDPNEGYRLLQTQDITRAYEIARQDMQAELHTGGLPDIDYSETATAVTAQTEMRNKRLAPRFKALSRMRVLMLRMLCDQAIKGRYETEFGSSRFSYRDFGDPAAYKIEVRMMSRSKKQEIVNIAIAGAAKAIGMSMKDIYTDILMFDDPEGALARAEAEKAQQADPARYWFDQVVNIGEVQTGLSGQEKKINEHRLKLAVSAYVRAKRQGYQMAAEQTQSPNLGAMVPLLGAVTKAGTE